MEAHTEEKPEGCLEQTYKNNLRIRLYQFTRNDGLPTHLVEIAAWNAWAGQGKIIYGIGGMDLEAAKSLFRDFSDGLNHYDWEQGELIAEDGLVSGV